MQPPDDVAVTADLVVGPVYHRFLMTGEPLTVEVVDALLPPLLRALGYAPVDG